jgi:hypothetical protein
VTQKALDQVHTLSPSLALSVWRLADQAVSGPAADTAAEVAHAQQLQEALKAAMNKLPALRCANCGAFCDLLMPCNCQLPLLVVYAACGGQLLYVVARRLHILCDALRNACAINAHRYIMGT